MSGWLVLPQLPPRPRRGALLTELHPDDPADCAGFGKKTICFIAKLVAETGFEPVKPSDNESDELPIAPPRIGCHSRHRPGTSGN